MSANVLQMTDKQRELFELGMTAAEKAGSQPKMVHGTQLTGKVEWYTPPEYIESARRAMGSIDVDPASSVLAQKIVKAKTYFSIHTNGLVQEWNGNVWLNPPYAASIIRPFVEKLIGFLQTGQVSQAIMLTHCNTDTRWYHNAWSECSAFCQTRGRVKFYDASGKSNSPTHGHLFMYFGRRPSAFKKEFKQYGAINRPWR